MSENLPKAGIELIKRFEGCKLTAYPDPASGGDPWTIGWGSTKRLNGQPFRKGDTITQAQADTLLEDSIRQVYLPALEKIPHFAEMSQEQVGALLSFAYNLGANFYGSSGFTTISRHLRNKDWDAVPDALLLYRNPGSNVEEGLRRRRVAEGALWSRGLSTFKASKRLIIAKQSTLLKKEPLQAFELGEKAKVEVEKGRAYTIVQSVDEGSHTKVVLDHGAGTWYVYTPHWDFVIPGTPEPTESGSKILLNVPYYSQRDSETAHAHRMCFSSSTAMSAEYLKPGCLGGGPNADDVMLKRVLAYGDTTNSVAQVRALADLGIHARFRTNLTRVDVVKQLKKGIPVPVGWLHKGPVSAPSGGGHWSTIVGIDLDTKHYIVNDPYGDCDLVYGGYPGSTNGARLRYSFRNFEPRWMVEGDGTGWGLLLLK